MPLRNLSSKGIRVTQTKIEFLPYDPMYQQYFLKECSILERLLRSNCINIYHVGATAIQNISSQPTLDLQCVVHTLDGIDHFQDEFRQVGLKFCEIAPTENKIVFERISKDQSLIMSRIHIYDKSDSRIGDYLALKDYFNQDAHAAKLYESKKIEFAQEPLTYEKFKKEYLKLIVQSLQHS